MAISKRMNDALRRRLTMVVLLIVASPALSTLPPSQAAPDITITVNSGLDGYCRQGQWLPIRMVLENAGPDLAGQVQVEVPRTGQGKIRYAQDISLPAGSRKEVSLLVFPEGFLHETDVVLLTGRSVQARVTSRVTCIGQNDRLFGIFADNPSPFNVLLDIDPPTGNAFLAHLDAKDLPRHGAALQILDALVVSNVDSGTLSGDQVNAISTWVSQGGQLILTGGPNWRMTLAGLSDLLPLNPTGTQIMPQLGALPALLEDSTNLQANTVVTVGPTHPSASVMASEDDTPILLQKAYGAGVVTFLATDPSLAPLKDWDRISSLYELILNDFRPAPRWPTGFRAWNYARDAVSSIPGLTIPSLYLICATLVFYILAIGPFNYLILRRWNRRELAWITIPGLVLIFTSLSYYFGSQTRGNKPILNRLAVVQVWPETSSARLDALLGLFSPARTTYTLQLNGDLLVHPLPTGFDSGTDGWHFVEDFPVVSVQNLQVEIGGIKSMVASGFVNAPQISHSLELNLDTANPRLVGDLHNINGPSLNDAVILAPGGALRLGNLPRGSTTDIRIDLLDAQARGAPGPNSPPYTTNAEIIEKIIGIPYYTRHENQEIFIRASLLNALMDPGGQRQDMREGVFLIGWTEESVIQAELVGRGFEVHDQTLYMFWLDVPVAAGNAEHLTLPPGLFVWRLLNPNMNRPASPYQVYLDPGSAFDFEYRLASPFPYTQVSSLTMNLVGAVNGPQPPTIYLWNFQEKSWILQSAQNWGRHPINNPHDYVASGGAIRARVELPNDQPGVFLDTLDFTLVVRP